VIRWVEDDAAVAAFAVAFGAEVGLVAKCEVDHAAFAGGHGSKVEGRASLANFFSGDAGLYAQFFQAQGALVLTVKVNLLVIAGLEAENFEGQEFEGAEKFAAAVEEQGRIGAGKVDVNFGRFPFADGRRVDDDAVFEVKAAMLDDGLQEFVDAVGGGYFVHKEAFSYQPSALSLVGELAAVLFPSE
jgi:hypothetical protein